MVTRATKLILGMALLAGAFLTASASQVFAASPQFMTSWSANSFAPSWYQGKIFPTKGSKFTVSFELVGQDSSNLGKILDLSNSQIKWYINDRFYTQQVGLKSITFTNITYPGSTINVRISAEVTNPSDGTSSFMDDYVAIPVVSPEVVIFNKNFSNIISLNSTVDFSAAPFFFNANSINDISAVWNVGGQQSDKNSQDPFSVSVKFGQNISPGMINVGITAQNVNNALETAASSLGFTIQ